MIQIAPNVLYLERADWGADPAYPPLGTPPVPRTSRTHLITHHTVGVDSDATKNIWENAAEVKAHMRYLQTVRPDLGNDVPYNFVLFPMADGSIIVCEGRGFDRWGAHTAGGFNRLGQPTMDSVAIRAGGQWHNGTGLATSIAGNHEDFGPDFGRYVQPYGVWLTYVLAQCPNVLTMKPARAVSWGHRDFYQTACPGQHVYKILPLVTIGAPASGPAPALEDDAIMPVPHVESKEPQQVYRSYMIVAGKLVYVDGKPQRDGLVAAGYLREPPRKIPLAQLKAIPLAPGSPAPDAP